MGPSCHATKFADKVVQALAVDLKRSESVEDIYSIVNTNMFDHNIGMPRGHASPMLYLTENRAEEDGGTTVNNSATNITNGQIFNIDIQGRQEDRRTSTAAASGDSTSHELYAASKGKGKGKVCWNC